MKYYINILLITVCSLLGSCSSILDKEPDFVSPEYYYNTEEEMTLALNGVYNRLIDNYGRTYSKGLFSHLVLSDESFYRSYSVNNIRVMVFDAAHIDITRLWEVLYEGINRANYLLTNIEGKELDTDNKKAIKGEALFLRGYYHFLLTSLFGEVPLKLTPTLSANDAYLPKSSFSTIYTQIVKDMQDAEKLVLDIDKLPSNERISKTGVQAILARVFLKMAGEPLKDESRYADALKYADLVITSHKHELNEDYSQIFINHSRDINESKECIWEIGMYGNKLGAVDLAGSVGVENGILCPDETIGFSKGFILATAKLYNSFEKNDLRRDWCIAPYQYVKDEASGKTRKVEFAEAQIYGRTAGKWRREYETGQKAREFNSTNFPVIRYSDVLLMKAEAENAVNNGPTDDAFDAVNQVRRRAFGKPVDTPDATCDLNKSEVQDKVDFMQKIQEERFREFCFEGRRKFDLLRWGSYVATMNSVGAEINSDGGSYKYGGAAGKNTTERNVVFPIPNTELTVNKLLVQNEGW